MCTATLYTDTSKKEVTIMARRKAAVKRPCRSCGKLTRTGRTDGQQQCMACWMASNHPSMEMVMYKDEQGRTVLNMREKSPVGEDSNGHT